MRRTVSISRLHRKTLDTVLEGCRPMREQPAPPGGWLRGIRTAMEMPGQWVAARMGITPSGLSHLERREAAGAVSLEVLRKAADAMDCDLVYAIVPRAGSVSAALENRAREVAAETLGRVTHTMRLEDQGTSAAEQDAVAEDLVRDLLSRPDKLWE